MRVFIVAGSPIARASLENLLADRDVEVAGSAVAMDALADQLSDVAPDVVLIDSSGEQFEPVLNSVTTSGIASEVSVVILADTISPGTSRDALRAGINVLPNDVSADQLVAALGAAGTGLLVVHPAQIHRALTALAPSPAVDDLVESLTRRERDVLQMLAVGLGNKEIAARLGISEHTVKFHVGSILGKLGAGSRTEAVSIGIRRRLILL
jgi:two-component system, NarL family, response regulator YdfI